MISDEDIITISKIASLSLQRTRMCFFVYYLKKGYLESKKSFQATLIYMFFRSARTFSNDFVCKWVMLMEFPNLASTIVSLRGIFWLYAGKDGSGSSLADLLDLTVFFSCCHSNTYVSFSLFNYYDLYNIIETTDKS